MRFEKRQTDRREGGHRIDGDEIEDAAGTAATGRRGL